LATVTYIPARRLILTALQRVFGSRHLVIVLSLVLGAALFLWARSELDSMFARDETGEIAVRISEASSGCTPPSLYLLPGTERDGSYYVAFDMLGGGIGDPSILNIGRPAEALAYSGDGTKPAEGRRAAAADCRHMELSIGGPEDRLVRLSPKEISDVANVAWPGSASVADGGGIRIVFDLPDGAADSAARTAFRIDGIRDVWQYGKRRLNVRNIVRMPVKVFLLGDRGYAFMSETSDPISTPVSRRSVAAMYLTAPGLEGGNAYQVTSRLTDYDASLQARLINVSTVFGIGISLMVEGFILLLLRLARRVGGAGADGGEAEER
jgi:hypothetical protein